MKKNLLLLLIVSFLLSIGCAMGDRDNANDPKSGSYKISASVSPGTGETISAHDDIVIHFTDAMKTSSVLIGGDIISSNTNLSTPVWSQTTFPNDTLTISLGGTKAMWQKGSRQLTVEGTTAEGKPMSKVTVTYNVVYRVYVNNTTGGAAPTFNGTRAKPFNTIQYAIDTAQALRADYPTATSEVYVAQGLYSVNYRTSGNSAINMKEGISVYGGYSNADWSAARNVASYVTTVRDASATLGSSADPNRAVYIDTTITSATVIDGFTIMLGSGVANAGIFCKGNATISYNTIQGSSTSGDAINVLLAYGISISSSAPSISYNTIDPGWNKNSGSSSYGIYNSGSTATISHNTITGGKGGTTYGVYDTGSSTETLLLNSIDCGGSAGVGTGYCIYLFSPSAPAIDGNTLTNSSLPSVAWGIYESSTNPAYVHNNHFQLSFFGTGGFYSDSGGSSNPVINLTTPISTQEDSGNLHPLNYSGWDNTL